MVVVSKTKNIKAKSLKKKAQKIKALTVTKYKGKLTYKIVKKGTTSKIFKKISINKKGVITLKKITLKKGNYKIKVKVTASGYKSYKSGLKTVTVKLKVK